MRIFTALLCIFLSTDILAQTAERVVPSEVNEATLFPRGTQLLHTARASVNAGITDVIIEGISSNIDQNSLQVNARGNVTILTVNFRVNHLKVQQKPREIQLLEDSVRILGITLEKIQNRQYALQEEMNMVLSNKTVKGEKGIDALDLEEVADFFRKRVYEIRNQQLEARVQERDVKERLDKYRNQLGQIDQRRGLPAGEIVVRVSARSFSSVNFDISYFNTNAGWTPFYDLRAENTSSPITLVYRANVWQRTGLDWENARLVLSTGKPAQSGRKPQLTPWMLNFGQPYAPPPARQQMLQEETEITFDFGDDQGITVHENQLSVEFRIDMPYDIPADGRPRQVSIQEYQMPAVYHYVVTPKLDRDAFLIAKVTGWERFNLLPGESNIFFEGGFVGKSHINTSGASDTLTLSLGRDKKVQVNRERVREFESTRSGGRVKREVYAYEISVRNTKREAIRILVEDQFPVSANRDIKVKLDEISNAVVNHVTGVLNWNLQIPPATSQNIKFGFTIEYPEDKFIPGL